MVMTRIFNIRHLSKSLDFAKKAKCVALQLQGLENSSWAGKGEMRSGAPQGVFFSAKPKWSGPSKMGRS